MTTTLVELTPAQAVPHPKNPRKNLGDLGELVESIKAIGVLEPVLVTPAEDGKYWILAGHRRHAAAIAAGLDVIPCLVRADLATEERQLETMLVENLQRADLTPIEEGDAYQALLEFPDYDARKIAKTTGRKVATVRSRVKLASLPDQARRLIHDGQITIADAEALAKFTDTPAALRRLMSAIGTEVFRWTLATEERNLAFDKLAAKERKRLEQEGVKVLDRPARHDWMYRSVAGEPFPCSSARMSQVAIEAHQSCPNRVVVLGRASALTVRVEIIECCTDAAKHLPADAAGDTHREPDGERAAAAQARDELAEKVATAADIRRGFIRSVIAGTSPMSQAAKDALMMYVAKAAADYDCGGLVVHNLADWIPGSLPQAERDDDADPSELDVLDPGRALLAAVASDEEGAALQAYVWSGQPPYGYRDPARWLTFLSTVLGYELTAFERGYLAERQEVTAAAA